MDSSFWFNTITCDGPLFHCIYREITGYNFKIIFLFLSLKIIVFVLANSVDLNEMPHDVAFHLGLHCLPKYA